MGVNIGDYYRNLVETQENIEGINYSLLSPEAELEASLALHNAKILESAILTFLKLAPIYEYHHNRMVELLEDEEYYKKLHGDNDNNPTIDPQ